MAKTVGDFIVDRLHQWGVKRMYGYPGDGINGMFGALNRAEGKIDFVQARHEEMAAFMASAYAKFTGELGVCIATSGPGASHLLTRLNDARLAHQPALTLVGRLGCRWSALFRRRCMWSRDQLQTDQRRPRGISWRSTSRTHRRCT